MINSLLKKDITQFLNIYPKFSYDERTKMKYSILTGEIDICDVNGNYWDTFKIAIHLEKSKYPHTIPLVKETSRKIIRNDDWHISDDGFCCLDIDHELEYLSKRGINITSFYQKYIYPFFANTLYKKQNGEYANNEYNHDFEGVIQFYKEKLKLNDVFLIIKILNVILINKIPERNQLCVCGNNIKIKKCHLNTIDYLKSLSKERIKKD